MTTKANYIVLAVLLPFWCVAQNDSTVLILQLQKNISTYQVEKSVNESQNNFQISTKEILCSTLNICTFKVYFQNYSIDKIIRSLNSKREIVAVQTRQKIQYRNGALNDSYFNLQWNLINDATLGGVADADTDAELAWAYGKGDRTKNGDSIVIAVIDIGFDINHEDLHFYTNQHEIPNDLIDNDNNGYVDDVHGWNIENGDGNTNTGNVSTWHGSSVSGAAAAIGNNSVGIAGIAYQSKILPVHLGDVLSDSVIKAYNYVIKMRELYNSSSGDSGAYVVAINSSFGISDSPNNNAVWCNLYDYMGSIGIVNATATDNKLLNYDVVDDVPGNCASTFIINTTYSDHSDNLGNCGYGKINVDIAAPAASIYLTRPSNQYALGTGTSFAAPQVAGTVAVLYSAACDSFLLVAKNNPDTAAYLIRKFILDGADIKTAFNNKLSSNGRLNVFNAVNEMRKFCHEDTIIPPLSNEFKIFWTGEKDGLLYFNFDLINKGTIEIFIYNDIGQKVAQYTSYEMAEANHTEYVLLQNLAAGIYYIQLSENGKKSNVKVFFMH